MQPVLLCQIWKIRSNLGEEILCRGDVTTNIYVSGPPPLPRFSENMSEACGQIGVNTEGPVQSLLGQQWTLPVASN